MKLTRAITHIRLSDANAGKLAQLGALADAYLHLSKQAVRALLDARHLAYVQS